MSQEVLAPSVSRLRVSWPQEISVEWGQGGSVGSSDSSTSTPRQQGQRSAGPVKGGSGSAADSSDPGKVTDTGDPKKFSIPDKEYDLEEVAKHNSKEDLWIAVKGLVMDLTNWVDEHPGGPQALYSHMGKDATEEFEMLHDDEVIPKYAPGVVIGKVKGQEVTLEY